LAAQVKLLETVYPQSGVDPTKVRYVEAHGPGTGTAVGDPIEASALGKKLGHARSEDEDSLWIGSVKGNFGHLEGASGIIGFIKAALVTFYGEIPPQLNHRNPNPSINFKALRLAIPTERIILRRDRERKLLVGVNSFGAGGANVHVILEEAPSDMCTGTKISARGARVFVLSAKSQSAFAHAARDLASHLRSQKPLLEDVAYTLNMRRDKHAEISVVTANGLDDICGRLDQLGSEQASKETLTLQKLPGAPSPKVAFVFSGQGGQWLGMGMRLAYQEPIFRDYLAAFDGIFTPLAQSSIIAEIFAYPANDYKMTKTTIAQPAIAAIQVSLARMLISYGVKPDSCVGHSIGEIAAAHISGALSLEEAVKVIYFRSQIQNKAAGAGSMLAAGASAIEAENLIKLVRVSGKVEIAAFNGPKMTTLTGTVADLELVASELEKHGMFARFIKVDTPYHSHFMDHLEDELLKALASFRGKETELSLYSTVTTAVEPGTHLTGAYWFNNIRKPVRYVETVEHMIEDGMNFLVEIGPHPVLLSGTRDIAEGVKRAVHLLPAMTRGSDVEPISRVIGAAHAVDTPVDILSFNGGEGHLIDLPLYPFQRQQHGFKHPEAQHNRLTESCHPFLGPSTSLSDTERGIIRLRLSTGVSPFLGDHVVDGAIVFPMTGHIEAAYLAASKYLIHQRTWLEDIRFEHPVVLAPAEDFAPQVMLEIVSPGNDFVISCRRADAIPAAGWQVCSRGRINPHDQPPGTAPESLNSVKARLQSGTEVDIDGFYQKLEDAGLRYGRAFRCVQSTWCFGNEAFSAVELPSSLNEEATRFTLHPALFDAGIHTLYAHQHYVGDPSQVYLPSHIGGVHLAKDDAVTASLAHIQVYRHDSTFLACHVSIYGDCGQLVAKVTGLTTKRLRGKSISQPMEQHAHFQLEIEEQASKTDANLENVLIINPSFDRLNWLRSTVQRALPRSTIYEEKLNAFKTSWESDKWGFNLDRRTLLIMPALSSRTPDLYTYDRLDAAIKTLTYVSSWIHAQSGTCMVVVLTEGGCMTPADTQCDPLAVSLEAAKRVMSNELPYSLIRIIDLAHNTDREQTTLLEAELQTIRIGRHETVVALRSEGRFVRRIAAVEIEEEENRKQSSLPERGGKYHAERSINGSLDGIILRQQSFPKLGPDEVGIEVHAAGLNFKDVKS
jgi:acyl transferase domain-containing protein